MRVSSHLDALIDETARAMTEGAPAGDIPAAVRQRLAGDGRAVPSWRPRLAAAAVALVALLVARSVLFPDTTASVLESRTGSRELTTAVPPGIGSTLRSAELPAAATGGTIVRRTARLSPVALIVVESLEVAPLADSRPMEIEVVELPMPLLADRLDIAPLVIQ